MSVVTSILEGETYRTPVTPSEAEGSKALGPLNRRAPSRPAPSCRRLSVSIGLLVTGPALFAAAGLRFLDSARKDTFTPGHMSGGPDLSTFAQSATNP